MFIFKYLYREDTLYDVLDDFSKLTLQTKKLGEKLIKLQKQEALLKHGSKQKTEINSINKRQLNIVHDCNGRQIEIGDRVKVITKGKYDVTHGTVTKISTSKKRVFLVGFNQVEIVRAPHNLCVVYD